MQPTFLNRLTLRELDSSVHTPKSDPATVRPEIVHLGLGGFHRAHMARYTHTLMDNQPGDRGTDPALLYDPGSRARLAEVAGSLGF